MLRRRLQQQLLLLQRRRQQPRPALHTVTPLLLQGQQQQQQHPFLAARAAAATAGSEQNGSALVAAGAAALASLLLAASSSASCDAAAPAAPAEAPDRGGGGAVLPMKEVMRLISAGLQDFRNHRFLGGGGSSGGSGNGANADGGKQPPFTSSYPKVAVLAKGKGADEPYTIEVPLPPSLRLGPFFGGAGAAGTEARVLAACLSSLQRAGYALTFHTGLTTPEGTSLSFVLDDGTGTGTGTGSESKGTNSRGGGSVALTSHPGQGAKASPSLVLYKTEGFTRGDIDAVVESYKAAWGGEGGAASGAGNSGPGGGPPGIIMNFADILDALRSGQGAAAFGLGPEAARDIFGPLLDPSPPASSSSSSSSVLPRPGGGGGGGSSGGSSSVLAPRSGGSSSSSITTGGSSNGSGAGLGAGNDPVSRLRKLGAEVFEKGDGEGLDWTCLAGYDAIREEVEDTVVLALQHAEAYEAVAKHTRARFESNRPRAVLFEGPPGTGKTLTARIIASRTQVPLVFIPTERILSKWYGDSEKNLAKVFEACQELGGAIIFIDEVDALATSRDSNMHEATRRLLSVLLQSIEGFKGGSRNVLICATNRKQDLDAALLSRFDVAVRFDLPSRPARQAVFGRYAKHLPEAELAQLADAAEGYSCRDVKEVCENAERRWASKLIRGAGAGGKGAGAKGGEEKEKEMSPPPLKEYLVAVRARGVVQLPGRHLSV